MEQDHMLAPRHHDRDDSKHLPPPLTTTNPFDFHPSLPPAAGTQPPPPSYGHHYHSSHHHNHSLSKHHLVHGSQSHDPKSLSFPDAPTTELAPLHHKKSSSTSTKSYELSPSTKTLPSFSTLTDSLSPLASTASSSAAASASPPDHSQHQDLHHLRSPPAVSSWPSLNPLTTYYTPSHALPADSPAKMDVEMSGTRAGSVSLDDPDVRMAAEALGDLRADFVSTTPQPNNPEPLLQLLTTSHPLLARTIEGTTSAYNNSKNFSPRFKSSAEYVEGYLTPIGNTLGSVGRVTGVEGGVRWFLRGSRRQPSSVADLESGDGARNKRRRMGDGSREARPATGSRSTAEDGTPVSDLNKPPEFDPYAFRTKERRTSMSTVDTLPAYDDHRSPAYIETETGDDEGTALVSQDSNASAPANAAWQQRLIMSTSGLSIAMSEESLRSLKYCLQWLRWANDHIGKVIGTLKATLDQYEQHPSQAGAAGAEDTIMAVDGQSPAAPQSAAQGDSQGQGHDSNELLGQRVAALKSDVLKTLRAVIDTVSKYAGGALPENARVLVRRHLTSLPQRFRLASQAGEPGSSSGSSSSSGQQDEKEVREGAQRVLLLAQEGLDMMAQVSGVLDGTIVSAEEWCARLGRKKQEERAALEQQQQNPQQQPRVEPLTGVDIDASGDIKMGGGYDATAAPAFDSKTG